MGRLRPRTPTRLNPEGPDPLVAREEHGPPAPPGDLPPDGVGCTRVAREGWATYWHHRIVSALELPPELQIEFLVHHNQVIHPQRRGINPYRLGFLLWGEIRREAAGEESVPGLVDARRMAEAGGDPLPGEETLLEVREVDRDVSFPRRFLTQEAVREVDLFEYVPKRGDLVVSQVSDPEGREVVKETLLRQVGMGSAPVIRIHDADLDRQGILLLRHEHDGRDLELEYARQTLEYVERLWGRRVLPDTVIDGEAVPFSRDREGGFERISRSS